MELIRKIWNKITLPDYEPLIEVRIFKDALLHNLHEFQNKYPNVKFAPVLKSNAYGHGLVQVAKILDNQAIAFFMVDSFYEALVLRRAGIASPILILGYVRQEQIVNNKLKHVSFGIIDFQQLKNIITALKTPQNFHLKVDTGMHRQGILMADVETAIQLIRQNPNFILEGVCTHFADADSGDKAFTESQIEKWNKIAQTFKREFPSIKYFHASNTAGSYFLPKIQANVARLGIGLYGFNTSPFSKLDLKPALEMKSIISSLKIIGAGEKVGYGIIFQAKQEIKIATVPVGYNEGVDRRLSNSGFFKVGGNFCPIVGRVSMNMSSIDVTQAPGVKLEGEVVVMSASKTDKNSIEQMAKMCGCTVYEILVHIPENLRRVVI